VGCHYEIISSQSEEAVVNFERDFAGAYFIKQAVVILNYKRAADEEGLSGAPHCTYEALEKQGIFCLGMSRLRLVIGLKSKCDTNPTPCWHLETGHSLSRRRTWWANLEACSCLCP